MIGFYVLFCVVLGNFLACVFVRVGHLGIRVRVVLGKFFMGVFVSVGHLGFRLRVASCWKKSTRADLYIEISCKLKA